MKAIGGNELANALKNRKRLAVVTARPAPRPAPFTERIAAIAALGASAVGGRCAIAWDSAGAGGTALAPVDDSRFDEVIRAGLAALDNPLSDAAAKGSKRVTLSTREIDSIGRYGKFEIPPAVAMLALVEGGISIRIVTAAAGAEGGHRRSSCEFEALLELLAGAVVAEISRKDAEKSAEFWRAYGAERVHYCRIAQDELKRERGRALEVDAAVAAARASMDREAATRSGLVRQLALRMFTAIDDERARIARDLHDEQAQLLAAAMIALEGGREEARAIFTQIEVELRRKTRELRPATLGHATLDEGIEREFRRVVGAGILATLVYPGAKDGISRPVQQLCFQVVREALSNVIRHASAKSVEVIVECKNSAARISVIDDGCGIDRSRNGDGIGLAGVRERLELMGGRLTVESCAGRTVIMAEIPEFGL
jgi:signal transduction histidine kinase